MRQEKVNKSIDFSSACCHCTGSGSLGATGSASERTAKIIGRYPVTASVTSSWVTAFYTHLRLYCWTCTSSTVFLEEAQETYGDVGELHNLAIARNYRPRRGTKLPELERWKTQCLVGDWKVVAPPPSAVPRSLKRRRALRRTAADSDPRGEDRKCGGRGGVLAWVGLKQFECVSISWNFVSSFFPLPIPSPWKSGITKFLNVSSEKWRQLQNDCDSIS